MKVKVKENAYYNETYFKAEQIVEINAKEVPAWAELIEDKKAKISKEDDEQEKSEEEKKEYLETLLNEAFEKEIFLEDSDKKTVEEQIAELEKLLNKGE